MAETVFLWYTKKDNYLTEEDVKRIVKNLASFAIKQKNKIEILKKDKYNISFIYKDSANLNETFEFLSEFNEDKKIILAEEIIGLEKNSRVVTLSGVLNACSLRTTKEEYKDLIIEALEILKNSSNDKIEIYTFGEKK